MLPLRSLKKNFSNANLQELYVSAPRMAKIYHTQAAKKKYGILTVPWACYSDVTVIWFSIETFYTVFEESNQVVSKPWQYLVEDELNFLVNVQDEGLRLYWNWIILPISFQKFD